MSTSILDNPDHWRERAEEARSVAEQLTDPVARAMMSRIAEDYERLAEHAQRRATRLDKRDPGSPAIVMGARRR